MFDDGGVVGFVGFVAGGGGEFVDGEGCGVGFSGGWGGDVVVFFVLVIGFFFCLLGELLMGRVLHGDGDGWWHEGTEVFG